MSSPSSPGNSWPIHPHDDHEEHVSDLDLSKAAGKHQNSVDGKESGASFDELVDRVLSPPMSKADSKFTAVFLCLYRKFAAPSDLMSAIIHRFDILNSTHYPHILRTSSQLRYLSVLTQWISDYPGDFAHPLTRQTITNFIAGLAETRIFAIASKEMNAYLDIVADDDDTEWACSDTSRSRASISESFLSNTSTRSTTSTFHADSETEEVLSDSVLGEPMQRQSTTTSIASSTCRSGSQSTGSFQSLLNSVESAQRLAQLLTPIPRDPLTKLQWHQFMETPEEDIAKELTRIDWIMFSSIRPRDFVRHVSLPVDMRERCKSLENVNRMIDHFNHVAFWVANTVLLRDKPKHRAKALERFMGVAWKLRHLNNYNSLGAVIAGINGTAVHRLAQTRELVPPQAQKQFMRLEILMGTQKGHFAYRLAWANTSSERIPFLPLHRRDLVFAEEGNRTHLGGDTERINWKKFDVMGEVIVGIQKSQGTPYPTISRNEEVQRLVLGGKFSKDDDDLYDRSIQIEGPRAGEKSRVLYQVLIQARPGWSSRYSSKTAAICRRSVHIVARTPAITPSNAQLRPSIRPFLPPPFYIRSVPPAGLRTIFIQTENTPNLDALKFLPNHPILPPGLSSTFLEYLSPRSTLAAPHPSPLAARLLGIDGISSVFYGPDFITVTKASDANWAHVKPEVFSLITEAVTSGEQIVNTIEDRSPDTGQDGLPQDTLAYNESDSEVVSLIKELLETRIRPSIQEDGGDIEFRGFIDGNVLLKLRGACRTCDSSTVTLKNGIESMLMHYIEEVRSVTQVLDQEEEIAMKEFAKFEEKLKEQKGPQAIASTVGKGSLNTAET